MSCISKEANGVYYRHYYCIPSHCPYIGKPGKTPHKKAGQHGESLHVSDKKTADMMAKELDRQLEELRRAVMLNQPIPKAKADFTLAQWREMYFKEQQGKKKASSLGQYRYTLDHLVQFLGEERKLKSLDRADMDSYYHYCVNLQKLSLHTMESRHGMLLSMFGDAVKREYIPTNPITLLHKAKPGKSQKVAIDRDKLAEAFQSTDEPWATLLKATYLTGGRISELIGLKRQWVMRNTQQFVFHEPKQGEDNWLHLYDDLLACFDRAAAISGKIGEYVFYNERGTPVSRLSAWRHFVAIGKPLGIHLNPHSLRHSRITHLMEDGIPIKDVMGIVGHKDIKTTLKYSHTSSKRQKEIAGKLSLGHALRGEAVGIMALKAVGNHVSESGNTQNTTTPSAQVIEK